MLDVAKHVDGVNVTWRPKPGIVNQYLLNIHDNIVISYTARRRRVGVDSRPALALDMHIAIGLEKRTMIQHKTHVVHLVEQDVIGSNAVWEPIRELWDPAPGAQKHNYVDQMQCGNLSVNCGNLPLEL